MARLALRNNEEKLKHTSFSFPTTQTKLFPFSFAIHFFFFFLTRRLSFIIFASAHQCKRKRQNRNSRGSHRRHEKIALQRLRVVHSVGLATPIPLADAVGRDRSAGVSGIPVAGKLDGKACGPLYGNRHRRQPQAARSRQARGAPEAAGKSAASFEGVQRHGDGGDASSGGESGSCDGRRREEIEVVGVDYGGDGVQGGSRVPAERDGGVSDFVFCYGGG